VKKEKIYLIGKICVTVICLLIAFFLGLSVPREVENNHSSIFSNYYPQTSDVSFYSNEENYFAKDINGSVISNGTDLGLVFQKAYNMHPYGTFFFTSGNYSVKSTMNITHSSLRIVGSAPESDMASLFQMCIMVG
jgi:hypothetical protein